MVWAGARMWCRGSQRRFLPKYWSCRYGINWIRDRRRPVQPIADLKSAVPAGRGGSLPWVSKAS